MPTLALPLALALAFQAPTTAADSVVARVHSLTRALTDTAVAFDSGFRPLRVRRVRMLEDLSPFQGQHWIHRRRVLDPEYRLDEPGFAMYVPIDGTWQLVGVAYSQRLAEGELVPEGLGGVAAGWHLHQGCFDVPGEGVTLADGADDCRARGGTPTPRQTAMVHVWTDVPSPEGPFAHDNPALPYLAVGLTPPGSTDWADAAFRTRARALALALGETYGARMGYARRVEFTDGGPYAAPLETHREAIRALIPALKEAQAEDDRAAFDELTARAIAEWEELRRLYEAMAPTPEVRAQVERQHREALGIAEHSGGHAGHEGQRH